MNQAFTFYDDIEYVGSFSYQFDCLKTKTLKVCVDYVDIFFSGSHMLQLLHLIHFSKEYDQNINEGLLMCVLRYTNI